MRPMLWLRGTSVLTTLVLLLAVTGFAAAQCPEKGPINGNDAPGQLACPCFVNGEEAGVIFDLPAEDFPIEILRVGVGWGSQLGGAALQTENAIHIYGAVLPDPGAPLFTLTGPQLNDGFVNEFDLSTQGGPALVNSGPFMVSLEFANDNVGSPFLASTIMDANGCQPGRNAVKAVPGGWRDGCIAGLSGDWVMHIVYRSTECEVPVEKISFGGMKSGFSSDGIGQLEE